MLRLWRSGGGEEGEPTELSEAAAQTEYLQYRGDLSSGVHSAAQGGREGERERVIAATATTTNPSEKHTAITQADLYHYKLSSYITSHLLSSLIILARET